MIMQEWEKASVQIDKAYSELENEPTQAVLDKHLCTLKRQLQHERQPKNDKNSGKPLFDAA